MPRYVYTPPRAETAEDAETVRFEDVRGLLRDLEDGDKASRRVTENVGDFDTFAPRRVVSTHTSPTNPGAPPRSKVLRPDAYAEWSATPAPSVRRTPVRVTREPTLWETIVRWMSGLFRSRPAATQRDISRRPSLQ